MIIKFIVEHPAAYDLITRALWTFLEAGFGALIIEPDMNWKAAIFGAVGAGLSAVKTLIIEIARKKLENKREDEGDA